MLLEPDGAPAWRSEDVLRAPAALPPRARRDARAGARAGHRPARDGGGRRLAAPPPARRAGRHGARPRPVRRRGRHPPTVRSEEVEVSPGARYQYLHATLRELARREPTFALHVHVAVPSAELAVRALDGVRAHIPVLLALAANSPFARGADSGLASARTPVFQAFPRTGIPRAFGSYAAYVEAVDVLLRCGAIPEPTFMWWDVRLQPRLGTLEVRVMDAQTRIRDTAALAALVQCLVRLEALRVRRAGARRPRGAGRESLPGRARRHRRAAGRPGPQPLRAGLRPPGHARRRLPPARPRAGLRARAGPAGRPRRRPGRRPPARDRRRAGPASGLAGTPRRLLATPTATRGRRLTSVWVTVPATRAIYRFDDRTGDRLGDPICFHSTPVALKFELSACVWAALGSGALRSLDVPRA